MHLTLGLPRVLSTIAILLAIGTSAQDIGPDDTEIFIPFDEDYPGDISAAGVNATGRMGISLVGFDECNKWQKVLEPSLPIGVWKSMIVQGFKDRGQMIGKEWREIPFDPSRYEPWYGAVDWQSAAAIEYFGPAFSTGYLRDQIQGKLDTQAGMVQARWWEFNAWKINVRCDDKEAQCLCKDPPVKTNAYTNHLDTDYFDHINFCPAYFGVPNLARAMIVGGQAAEPSDINGYWNQGSVWAHEIMHVTKFISPIGREGWMPDIGITKNGRTWRAYRSLDTKYLSFTRSKSHVLDNINNPQNYALYLLANYIQRVSDFYPNVATWFTIQDPPEPPPNAQAIDFTANLSTAQNAEYAAACVAFAAGNPPTPSSTLSTVVVSSTSAPPSTTTEEPPEETPTAVLEEKPVVCNDEADFPGHADIQWDAVVNLANVACNDWKGTNDGIISDAGGGYSTSLQDGSDVNYAFSAIWIEGCHIADATSQGVWDPLGNGEEDNEDTLCPNLFTQSYSACNNGGVGGYIDVGCVRYRFDGGK